MSTLPRINWSCIGALVLRLPTAAIRIKSNKAQAPRYTRGAKLKLRVSEFSGIHPQRDSQGKSRERRGQHHNGQVLPRAWLHQRLVRPGRNDWSVGGPDAQHQSGRGMGPAERDRAERQACPDHQNNPAKRHHMKSTPPPAGAVVQSTPDIESGNAVPVNRQN